MQKTTEKLIRKDLKEFSAYCSARSVKVSGQVWLNANESPYNDANLYNRYPEQQPQILIEKLAKIYKVAAKNLLLSRGSDEGIDLLIRLYCEYQKDSIFTVEPTFGMYRVAAQLQGAKCDTIKLKEHSDFEVNISDLLANIPDSCKLLFLSNPNNPTGRSISLNEIKKILNRLAGKCIVVIDEAYIEFSNQSSVSSLVDEYENLVVLRTLSKYFGMAGLRLGILITNHNRITWLRKILPPYPIPKTTQSTVLEMLDEKNLDRLASQVSEIKQQREYLFEKLGKMQVVNKLYPSTANFILVRFNSDVFDKLLASKIVVRDMSKVCNDKKMLRISVGNPLENKILIDVLQQIEKDYATE